MQDKAMIWTVPLITATDEELSQSEARASADYQGFRTLRDDQRAEFSSIPTSPLTHTPLIQVVIVERSGETPSRRQKDAVHDDSVVELTDLSEQEVKPRVCATPDVWLAMVSAISDAAAGASMGYVAERVIEKARSLYRHKREDHRGFDRERALECAKWRIVLSYNVERGSLNLDWEEYRDYHQYSFRFRDARGNSYSVEVQSLNGRPIARAVARGYLHSPGRQRLDPNRVRPI